MTSAESTLLGLAVGAALTWIANAFSSRTQWQREERRAHHDRQREHRTALYQDMLKRTRRLVREQSLFDPKEEPPIPSPEQIAEVDDWAVRVALFASPDVSELWDAWLELHISCGRIQRRGLKTEADRNRYLDLVGHENNAHDAIVAKMRRELEGRDRQGAGSRLRGLFRLARRRPPAL